jgi:large subunit ribosomal protein L9
VKLLLRADVQGVGKKGDLVEVADGYGRNYLLPKGFAVTASSGVEQQAAAMRRSRDLKDAADRAGAEEIAKVLVPAVVTVTERASDEGKLFGSVSAHDVLVAVAEQTGIELERRHLLLDEAIKTVGTHSVPVRLHGDVEFQVTLEVAAG